MAEPREYQTEAIIIKKAKLGEADRILTLYTPDLGKIQGFAKGVRRPKSKLSGHLELLTHSLVSLVRGRNMDTIIGSQTINSFLPLKSDLWLTSYGLYVAELVNQFTAEHIKNPSLFKLFLDTLNQLCQAVNNELVLRYFELHLLSAVGYQPELHQCVSCQKLLEPVVNAFCSSAGGTLCPDCRHTQPLSYPLSVDTLKVLRFLQRNDYGVIIKLKTNAELSHELKTVTAGYIRYLLEREVKSAAWLDSLREGILRTAPK
jgi:DNA repair protein RecO (recombination protein O)